MIITLVKFSFTIRTVIFIASGTIKLNPILIIASSHDGFTLSINTV